MLFHSDIFHHLFKLFGVDEPSSLIWLAPGCGAHWWLMPPPCTWVLSPWRRGRWGWLEAAGVWVSGGWVGGEWVGGAREPWLRKWLSLKSLALWVSVKEEIELPLKKKIKTILTQGYVYWFERERENREKLWCETETLICCFPYTPWLGIKPATSLCMGRWCPSQLSHPAGADWIILKDFQLLSSVVLPQPGLYCQQALLKTLAAEDWDIYLGLFSGVAARRRRPQGRFRECGLTPHWSRGGGADVSEPLGRHMRVMWPLLLIAKTQISLWILFFLSKVK